MELTTLQNGRYKIETVLGQGGFGITYRAVQTSLGRTVAIKEFFMKDYCERSADSTHVTMGTQSTREMVMRYCDKFEKEARTLARLEHPHIVRVIDVFQENNTSYYVMEYAEGTSLKQQVDEKGPLPEARAVGYIRQVAGALRYLHGQRICHLDIKPANILTKANGEAVLADFGLAKQYDEAGGETSTTPVGKSKGFAPPEQYRTGGVKSFSPETDIYALGATLYFLLTGKTPPEAVLLNEESLDVSLLSPRMAKAVQAAMQLRRADRATLDAFEKLIGGEEKEKDQDDTDVVADVVKKPEPKPKPDPVLKPVGQTSWRKARPYLLGLGGVLLLCLGIFLIERSSGGNSSEVSEGELISQQRDSVAVADSIAKLEALANVSASVESTSNKPEATEGKNDASATGNESGTSGRVSASKPVKNTTSGSTSERKQEEKLTPQQMNVKGNEYYNKRMYKEAVKWYRKSADQGFAYAQYNLGYCYNYGQGVSQDYSEAVKWYRKAAEQGNANGQCGLGSRYYNGEGVSQDYSEAVKWYRKAADQGHASAQYNLGYCYNYGQGVSQDYSEAVKWYRKAAEQGNANGQCGLGVCYYNGKGVSQDYSEAVKWFRKSAEQGNAKALYNLGICYEYGLGVSKDLSEAKVWYRKAANQGHAKAKAKLQELNAI